MIVFTSLNSCFVEASNLRALDPGCSRGCGAQSLSLWSGTSPGGSGVQGVNSQGQKASLCFCAHPVRHYAGTSSAQAQSHRSLTCKSQVQKVLDTSLFVFGQIVANIAVIVKHHLHWVWAKQWPSFLHLTDETVRWWITGVTMLPFWNWRVLCAGSNSAPRVSDERL